MLFTIFRTFPAGVDNLNPQFNCVDEVEIGFFSKLSFLSPLFQIEEILLTAIFLGFIKLMPVLLRIGPVIGDLIDALLFDRYFSCETEVGRLEAFLGEVFFSVGVVGILDDDGTREGGFSLEAVALTGDVGASLTTGTFSNVGSS